MRNDEKRLLSEITGVAVSSAFLAPKTALVTRLLQVIASHEPVPAASMSACECPVR
jgi:hypothetical protein